MSAFVGIVRWGDDRRLDPREGERLASAVAVPGQARPALLSAPPLHAAFRQTVVTPEDAGERQPAAAGDAVSLFAGRIDDRDGLAGRLGLSPAGLPDGALALAAFRRWGADAAGEVVGEFAWAAWDGAARRLVLALDPSVARTLYLCRTGRFVAFATGLRALFALPEVPREVDEQGLAEFLVINPGIGERTLYRGVARVLPGTTLLIDRDGLRRTASWQPRPVAVPRRPREVAEAAREVFGRALRARLRALGPTAVSLSGGLDSAIVAAEAARLRAPGPVHGFVLVPQAGAPLGLRWWEEPDDRAQVEALARAHPNLRVTYVEPGSDPLDADPTALFVEAGHPVMLGPNLTWMLAGWRAARAAGARLILTGGGGEISLTHYGSLRAVVRQGDLRHALREAWLLGRRRQGSVLGQLDRAFLGGRLTRLRDRGRGREVGEWRRYSAIHPDLAASAGLRDLLLAEGFPGGAQHDAPSQREIVARRGRWSALPAENVAALRHLTGLEQTSPFTDSRVVEFCLALPEAMFVRDGWPRWLARAAFRDVLPPEVGGRLVKAAQNPEWFHRLGHHRPALRAQLERIETSPLAARALDLPRLKALLDDWPATPEAADAAGSDYRSVLVRGLQAGAFLRWLDSGNGA